MKEHRLAALTTFACFLLLLAGGLVHATGSGMACGPDWPLCKGEAFPRMEGGVLFEHGHRLVAASVATLTAVLAIMLWRARRLRALGLSALALVIVQALLGMLTVRWNLPMAVKTVHLAVSMAFFSLLVLITFRSHPDYAPAPASRRLVGLAAIGVYLQIVLGAFVRHTSSGLACPDIPLCNGRFWSSWGPAELQMAHRYFGTLVGTLVIVAAVRVWRQSPWFAVAALVLVPLQITLGLLSVATYLGTYTVTAHLGTGALLLADLVSLFLSLGWARSRAESPALAEARA